jgi:hypothetical protein
VLGGIRRSDSNTGKGFELITTPPPLVVVVAAEGAEATTIMIA